MTIKFVEPTNEHVGQIVQVSSYGESWSHRKLLAILPSTQGERFVCEADRSSKSSRSWKLARIPSQSTYAELQEESGLKVGDTVKVLRKCVDGELGWENVWVEGMDKAIGQVYTIREITKYGIKVDLCVAYCFPYFVLEKYKETTKEEKIENLVNEFVERLKELLTKANEEV